MKITLNIPTIKRDAIFKTFSDAAIEFSVEYGILIRDEFIYNYDDKYYHVYFVCNDKKFECLKDLKKALNNKAFW